MRVVLITFFSLILLGGQTAHADFDPETWAFQSKITAGFNVSADFVVLDLPSAFFSSLKPDLSDLRVVNQDGEVPYVIAAERETETFTAVPARLTNLSSAAGVSTSFIIDVGQEGTLHNALTINTPSENFRRIVEVQGSNDQKSWRTLTPRGQIFDYTVRDIKPVAVRDARVSYPDTTFRYLLVTIFDQGEAPLTVQGVSVSRHVSLPARELSYKPTLTVTPNEAERATDIILDLLSRGIPHRRGVFTTESTNFNRAVSIFASDDKINWQLLGHEYVYAIDTTKFRGARLDFHYPESTKQYLKLSILNRDDRPITVTGVELFGVARSILFHFNPTRAYSLYLGNPQAKRPQYDIEKISQYVDTATLNRVSVEALEPNTMYKPPEPTRPPLAERSPYVLPSALGVIVAVLAFLLLRVVTKTTTTPVSM